MLVCRWTAPADGHYTVDTLRCAGFNLDVCQPTHFYSRSTVASSACYCSIVCGLLATLPSTPSSLLSISSSLRSISSSFFACCPIADLLRLPRLGSLLAGWNHHEQREEAAVAGWQSFYAHSRALAPSLAG